MSSPASSAAVNQARAVLAQLPLRSVAYWGTLVLKPCLEYLARQKWWHFSRRRTAHFCRTVLADLVAGRTEGMAIRRHEAARAAEGLTLEKSKAGCAAEALYSFFSQLGVAFDLFQDGEREDLEKYYESFVGSLAASADVADADYSSY